MRTQCRRRGRRRSAKFPGIAWPSEERGRLFDDCELGAIPTFGKLYGMDMMVDDSLSEQPDVYFEAGDHRSMIHVNAAAFQRLTADARHGRFSRHD